MNNHRMPVSPLIYLYPLSEAETHHLNRLGTLEDLEKYGVVLKEGLQLTFYDDDDGWIEEETGQLDRLLFEGTVHLDGQNGKWFAAIDWASCRRESDTQRLEPG